MPRLYPPRPAVRILPGVDWTGNIAGWTNYLGSVGSGFYTDTSINGETTRTYLDAGENPPRGALVIYHLEKEPSEPLTLEFRDKDGKTIRSFSSRLADDPTKAKELRAPANKGGNRFTWDLRHKPVTKIAGDDPAAESEIPGAFVPPGTYTVTLTADGKSLEETFDVIPQGGVDTSQDDFDAQYKLSLRICDQLDRTARAINRMRDLRSQLDGLAARSKGFEGAGEIPAAAEETREHVLELEKLLAVPDLRPGWADGINAGARLYEKLAGLPELVHMGDYRPTDAAEEAFVDMSSRIEAVIDDFDHLIEGELADLNAAAIAAGLPATVVQS